MYIFEFTDASIKIYNSKSKKLIKEDIPLGVIKDNKIYDYLKLLSILNKIVNKHKLINSLFRVKVKILIFEKMSPSEIYLFKYSFKFTSNVVTEIVNVSKLFKGNYLLVSGNIVYMNNKVLKKLKKCDYILIGNSDSFEDIKNSLEKKYQVRILEYENSDTIIYEKV